jgi:cellulose synthase/poly-beta-1,6-N-acetylglucosamine synthase-like glycosyltransferase
VLTTDYTGTDNLSNDIFYIPTVHILNSTSKLFFPFITFSIIKAFYNIFPACYSTSVLFVNRNRDFGSILKTNPRSQKIHHLVVLSCYKEPIEVLKTTIDSIANQTMASSTTMVVSFEEKSPNWSEKQSELWKFYGSSFHDLFFTVHPFGIPNEIPGKCSNCNCGIRTAVGHIRRKLGEQNFDSDNLIITTCDADSKFHPRFLEALTLQFLNEKDPHSCVFQVNLIVRIT